MGLSLWPGARAVLRRAEREPEILVTDPSRRRVRGRRVAVALVPLYSLIGAVVGYLVDLISADSAAIGPKNEVFGPISPLMAVREDDAPRGLR